jgi:hypothetical protein
LTSTGSALLNTPFTSFFTSSEMAAIATFCFWAKHLQVHSITKAINEEVQDPKSHGRLGQNSHYGLHQLAMTILHGNQEAMDRLETPQSWTACMGLQPQP